MGDREVVKPEAKKPRNQSNRKSNEKVPAFYAPTMGDNEIHTSDDVATNCSVWNVCRPANREVDWPTDLMTFGELSKASVVTPQPVLISSVLTSFHEKYDG